MRETTKRALFGAGALIPSRDVEREKSPRAATEAAMKSKNSSDEPSRLLLALRSSSLFRSLSNEVLAALQAQLTQVTLISGEVLFRKGDPSDSLYIVISGRLLVLHVADDQTERMVTELGHGEIVGETGHGGRPARPTCRSRVGHRSGRSLDIYMTY